MDNIHSLRFFWPESVLTVAVLAMLVQDLIVRRSGWQVPSLVAGALFWLALTAAATWATTSTTTPLFGGLLQHDPLRLFFAWLFLGAAFLTVIIVPKSAQLADVTSRLFMAQTFGGQPAAQLALVVAVIFVLAGVGYKIASVPFHMWCPDVYEGAPTPFTAFLSVGPKAAGFAVAIRFFFAVFERQLPGGAYARVSDLPWPAIIGIISAATMTLGNVTALVQDNLKRMLAYSSIAHAGYLLMGLAAASAAGVQSILVYLVIYVFMNVGAFLVVIAVSRATGGETVADFRGLGTRAPIAALALTVFLFSLTGLPPFAGFTGKYLIFAALVQRGGLWNVVLAVIGVVNSALSLFYYARIIKAMYLEDAPAAERMPVPALYTGVLVALTVPLLVFGLYWGPLVRWAATAFGGSGAT